MGHPFDHGREDVLVPLLSLVASTALLVIVLLSPA